MCSGLVCSKPGIHHIVPHVQFWRAVQCGKPDIQCTSVVLQVECSYSVQCSVVYYRQFTWHIVQYSVHLAVSTVLACITVQCVTASIPDVQCSFGMQCTWQ